MTEEATYIVLKIGDKVFSTEFFKKPKHTIDFLRKEETDNIWVKGEFTEKKGHVVLKKPIPFELNIYVKGGRENGN